MLIIPRAALIEDELRELAFIHHGHQLMIGAPVGARSDAVMDHEPCFKIAFSSGLSRALQHLLLLRLALLAGVLVGSQQLACLIAL